MIWYIATLHTDSYSLGRYKSLSPGLTPAKNTNVGDKSMEYQRGDPWKNEILFSKKFSDLNKYRLKNSKKIY